MEAEFSAIYEQIALTKRLIFVMAMGYGVLILGTLFLVLHKPKDRAKSNDKSDSTPQYEPTDNHTVNPDSAILSFPNPKSKEANPRNHH